MNTPFNGERLKKARIYRGLTVAELAERVGCQRQTLSMYEISKSQPTDKTTVSRLAKELDFPVKYFYEHSNSFASGTVYFRSLLTTNKKYRSEQIVKMDYLSQIYSLLQDYVAFPEYDPLDLPDNVTPEQAAYALRDAWGLGALRLATFSTTALSSAAIYRDQSCSLFWAISQDGVIMTARICVN